MVSSINGINIFPFNSYFWDSNPTSQNAKLNYDVNSNAKRMKTLNVSMDNLLLTTNQDEAKVTVDEILTTIKEEPRPESTKGGKRTASSSQQSSQIGKK